MADSIESTRTAKEAQLAKEYAEETARIERNATVAANAAAASALSQAAQWRSKAKGSPANIAWAKKQAAQWQTKADVAKASALAQSDGKLTEIRTTKERKLAELKAERDTSVKNISAHNLLESDKSEKSKATIGGAFQNLSIFTVLALLGMYWVISRVTVKSGMYLITDPDDSLQYGSTFSRFWYAITHLASSCGHNIAAWIYEKAPEKREFGVYTVDTAGYTPPAAENHAVAATNNVALQQEVEELRRERDALLPYRAAAEQANSSNRRPIGYRNPTDGTAPQPTDRIIPLPVAEHTPQIMPTTHTTPPPILEIENVYTPEYTVYTPETPENRVGEEFIYSVDELKENDHILNENLYTTSVTELFLSYKEARKNFNSYKNRTQTPTTIENIARYKEQMNTAQTALLADGLKIAFRNRSLVLITAK